MFENVGWGLKLGWAGRVDLLWMLRGKEIEQTHSVLFLRLEVNQGEFDDRWFY